MRTCIKCNNTSPTIKYFAKNTLIKRSNELLKATSSYTAVEFIAGSRQYYDERAVREHLICTCSTCGYAWLEDTDDNKPQELL